ncbi:MAG: ubiquinol-cytochrome C chaperone family protein [Hyphomicrobiales bacterium]
MLNRLFPRLRRNRDLVEKLHATVMIEARQMAFFSDLGVPDTVEGRFDVLTLHLVLVVRRLNMLPSPGPEIAQDLVDTAFRHFDSALREMGVGDVTVPKRMKALAEAFLGRAKAYEDALRRDVPDALTAAVLRNIYANRAECAAFAGALGAYVRDAVMAYEGAELALFERGQIPKVSIDRFIGESKV